MSKQERIKQARAIYYAQRERQLTEIEKLGLMDEYREFCRGYHQHRITQFLKVKGISMRADNYFVIGGQYKPHCYGYCRTLGGAKQLAAQNCELWDNWQGWHYPKVYRAKDCSVIDCRILPWKDDETGERIFATPVAVKENGHWIMVKEGEW